MDKNYISSPVDAALAHLEDASSPLNAGPPPNTNSLANGQSVDDCLASPHASGQPGDVGFFSASFWEVPPLEDSNVEDVPVVDQRIAEASVMSVGGFLADLSDIEAGQDVKHPPAAAGCSKDMKDDVDGILYVSTNALLTDSDPMWNGRGNIALLDQILTEYHPDFKPEKVFGTSTSALSGNHEAHGRGEAHDTAVNKDGDGDIDEGIAVYDPGTQSLLGKRSHGTPMPATQDPSNSCETSLLVRESCYTPPVPKTLQQFQASDEESNVPALPTEDQSGNCEVMVLMNGQQQSISVSPDLNASDLKRVIKKLFQLEEDFCLMDMQAHKVLDQADQVSGSLKLTIVSLPRPSKRRRLN